MKYNNYFIMILIFFLFFSTNTIYSKNNFNQEKLYKKFNKNLLYLDKNQKNFEKKKNKISNIEREFTEIINSYKYISKNGYKDEQLRANINLFFIFNHLNKRDYLKNFQSYSNFLMEYNIENLYKKNLILIKELIILETEKNNLDKAENYFKYFDYMINSLSENLQKNYSNYDKNYNLIKEIQFEKNKLEVLYNNILYENGTNILNKINVKKYEFRNSYKYFNRIKKHTNSYNDLESKILKAKDNGFFKYSIYTTNPIFYTNTKNLMKNIGIESNTQNDLQIIYNEDKSSYLDFSEKIEEYLSHRELIGINSNGSYKYRIYNYKKISTILKRKIKINYTVSFKSNFYNNSISDYVVEEFPIISVEYVGDVPWHIGLKNSYYSNEKEYTILKNIEEKVQNKIYPFIRNTIYYLEKF